MRIGRAWMLAVLCLMLSPAEAALDASVVTQLGSESTDDKIAAIQQLSATPDPLAATLLKALGEGDVYKLDDGKLIIVSGDSAVDAATGAAVSPIPESKDQLIVNNRLRKAMETAQASGQLFSPDRGIRLAAA